MSKDVIDYMMEAREAREKEQFGDETPESKERKRILEGRSFWERVGDFMGVTDTYEDNPKRYSSHDDD